MRSLMWDEGEEVVAYLGTAVQAQQYRIQPTAPVPVFANQPIDYLESKQPRYYKFDTPFPHPYHHAALRDN